MHRGSIVAPAGKAGRKSGFACVVMKFGGSSLATADKIRRVAAKVAAAHAERGRVVVVVSAMGKTTDELVALAGAVSGSPAPRELDVLLSAGERISIALLAMALEARGVPAVSMTGRQCGIETEGPHTRARIAEIRPERVLRALDEGRVVVVAGFQGVDGEGDVTTLGRGGSDTTAVALAAALGAATCDIHSDVDGVYSTDPRLCPAARHLDAIDYDTMQELSRQGARVLHARAVEHARRGSVTIRARATAGSAARTLIGPPPESGDEVVSIARARPGVLAVAGRRDLIRILARDAETAAALREALGERVPTLHAHTGAEGEELWAIAEELPDARAFARSLEARWPGRVQALAGLGSAALIGPRVDERVEALLASVLESAGIQMHVRARSSHAAFATIDAAHVDDAIRALHRAAIETGDEGIVSCAS